MPGPWRPLSLLVPDYTPLSISISGEMPGPWRRITDGPNGKADFNFNLRRDARPLAT